MKLTWSPDSASKAYLDTVRTCQVFREWGVAELVEAMAAGWNAQFIVETWMQGEAIGTSIGLAIARSHTGGRHVCVVPDHQSGSEYAKIVSEADVSSLLGFEHVTEEINRLKFSNPKYRSINSV